MEINADFSRSALVIPKNADWRASPLPGVDRLMLDRIGEEVARATSIVRYERGSQFSSHTHDQGEEFLVLEGTFSDASGDFPAGSYVRNPPGSSHAPWSEDGCTILVKLRQFDSKDLERVVVDTRGSAAWSKFGTDGVAMLQLHRYATEQVDLLRVPGGAGLMADGAEGGLELFVYAGSLDGPDGLLPKWSWLRLPPGEKRQLMAQEDSVIYRKTGHLTELKR